VIATAGRLVAQGGARPRHVGHVIRAWRHHPFHGLRYSLQHQAKTGGLTPIRLVEHVYIDPKTGAPPKIVF
jgi:hypothetical protein